MIQLAVEELWPESLAEDWDEVGLVAGHPAAEVRRVMFAVDPTIDVIEEAIDFGAELLITHHPLLLKGVTSVAANTAKGKAVHRLIESGTALMTVHTNGDSAVGGVSDVLADALGLQNVAPLTPAANGLPEEGIGRVGDLDEVLTLGDFAARVFGILPSVAGGVRVSGDRDGLIRRVAVCGGAGDSLFGEVRASNADVYVTADLRHHPASEAREGGGQRPAVPDRRFPLRQRMAVAARGRRSAGQRARRPGPRRRDPGQHHQQRSVGLHSDSGLSLACEGPRVSVARPGSTLGARV